MFKLKQEQQHGGVESDMSSSKMQDSELLRSVAPTRRIVYTTTRPNDFKAPYEKMVENNVGFGSHDKRSGGFLNSALPVGGLGEPRQLKQGLDEAAVCRYRAAAVWTADKYGESYVKGTCLKKDDPKIIALFQQAKLLSSLALKVNTEKTDESYENACKAVQDFLKQTKECDVLGFNISDMDIRSCDECSQHSWRQPDLYQGSPDSSEYSTGSTVLSQVIETMELSQDNIVDDKITIMPDSTTNQDILASCDEFNHDVNAICPLPNSEFNSPLQVTPLFRSMAAGIPSPQFSESERSFLLKTLGMESTPPKQDIKTSQPHCKRALLHCL